MKAKERVLKIRPDAYCSPTFSPWGFIILAGGSDCKVALGHTQNRESWAWADAYRNLTSKNINTYTH